MIKSTTAAAAVSTTSRTMANKVLLFGVALILLIAVNNSFAAPANSNEDQIGFAPPSSSSRQAYRNQDANPPLVEYNIVPVVPESGMALDTPLPLGVQRQQPMDLGIILNYLLSRHYAGAGNRARFIPDMDSAKNEYTRKRSSYSRYCAFNAVSCFGRKK